MKPVIVLKKGWTKESMLKRIFEKNNNDQCIDNRGQCVYRDLETGNACAIGAFFPDEVAQYLDREYRDTDSGIQHVLFHEGDLFQYLPTNDIPFLKGLQGAHDNAFDSTVYESVENYVNCYDYVTKEN